MRRLALPHSCSACWCACGGGDKPAAAPAAAPPPPPQKTVIDTQLKALDKAKAVQGVVDDQKDTTDQTLKDAGGLTGAAPRSHSSA